MTSKIDLPTVRLNWLVKFNHYLEGRALEFYLASIKLLFGAFLLPEPYDGNRIVAFADLVWWYPPVVLATPFFVIGLLQHWFLWWNYRGYEVNYSCRYYTAAIAFFLWSFILIKHLEVGVVVTGVMPFIIMSLPGNIWIWWRATNRLPLPGYHGY